MLALDRVGLIELPPAKEATLTKAQATIRGELKSFVPQLESNEFLQQADWRHVLETAQLNARIGSANPLIDDSTGGSLAIIARGSAELIMERSGSEKVQDILGPGSMIGAMSLLTRVNNRTVRALTPVEGLWLIAEKLRPIMAEDSRLATNLAHLMDSQENS